MDIDCVGSNDFSMDDLRRFLVPRGLETEDVCFVCALSALQNPPGDISGQS